LHTGHSGIGVNETKSSKSKSTEDEDEEDEEDRGEDTSMLFMFNGAGRGDNEDIGKDYHRVKNCYYISITLSRLLLSILFI
jgi:U3 small nucleolar RNA-associated protein 14